MATANDSSDKYKSITGSLKERFGFRLSADTKTVSMESICCMHCHKVFAYHRSNTS